MITDKWAHFSIISTQHTAYRTLKTTHEIRETVLLRPYTHTGHYHASHTHRTLPRLNRPTLRNYTRTHLNTCTSTWYHAHTPAPLHTETPTRLQHPYTLEHLCTCTLRTRTHILTCTTTLLHNYTPTHLYMSTPTHLHTYACIQLRTIHTYSRTHLHT